MPRNRFYNTVVWIDPKRVPCAFAFLVTAVLPKMPQEISSFHAIVMVSRIAFFGTP